MKAERVCRRAVRSRTCGACYEHAGQALAALVRLLQGDPNLKAFFLAAPKSVAQKAGRKVVNRIERIGVLRDDGM